MKTLNKISLGQYPTPLAKLEKISALTGVNCYIKRDDLCGISLGGNKVRKLEYLLAQAQAEGCDTVLTSGGAQSNHATLTAACCRKLGLDVTLVLKKRGVTEPLGNLLLDRIYGVEVVFVDTDTYKDVYAEADRIMETLRKAGKKPFFIPVGGSVPLGAVGYYDAVVEMTAQAAAQGFRIDHILCCSGSGGTHGGILLGAKLCGNIQVTGVLVSVEENFEQEICSIANGAAQLIGAEVKIGLEDVILKDYIGPGYAQPSPEGSQAIRLMAREEGILVDPVYTGKTFAGFLDLCKKGYFSPGENVVFLHSGGAAALFAIPLVEE